MKSYTTLARFYDSLTTDVPYGKFADFYEMLFRECGRKVGTVLDLACGTGSMTRELISRGYEMIGADASPDMLSIAAQKTAHTGIAPVLICQSMEELDLYGTVDAAVCTLDGVNYVKNPIDAFRRVLLFLEPGGLFIFDINTPEFLRNLDGGLFADETDDIFCIWRTEFMPEENACFYGMDIFTKTGKLWLRENEEHIEYAHEPEELRVMLLEIGFSEVTIYGELTKEPPREGDLRVFIAARK